MQTVADEQAIHWAAISGRWDFPNASAVYLEGSPSAFVGAQPLAIGLTLTNLELQDGVVRVEVNFSNLPGGEHQGAGIVLGYQSPNERYIVAQLGASQAAYSLSEFTPGFGWQALITAGSKANLEPNRDYLIQVFIRGQRVRMEANGVRIFEQVLRLPLPGRQIGLIASGPGPVHFNGLEVQSEPAVVFVAMQFGGAFDTMYREVIQPVVSDLGLQVLRLDEIARPGIIFEDIKRHIAESKIVIAEITAPNQNVFYELGYAHALNKPTILLAQRGRELPFDIKSYRVIFYDDSIGGKPVVERELKKHLRAVLQDS